ncbi:MAG: ATP-dependent protease ATPase subunit HslU, partial [Clostridia bacterium]|nr:ATP-dependent protease ATPase subunit HslU [Clostridia bacterium]
MNLSPKQIVDELNKYIIGQDEAKKSVAIALRNRYRRSQLPKAEMEEITPKNIIMKGPTGVGKTEIARRLAKLVNAPFIKVEATKYTEVGYVGRDVESMIRDLVECSVRLVKEERFKKVMEKASATVDARLVKIIAELRKADKGETPAEIFEQNIMEGLKKGYYNNEVIEIEINDNPKPMELVPGGAEISIGSIFGDMMPKKKKRRKLTVKEAREILIDEEADKLIDKDSVNEEAIKRAEQEGIIFIDEIDKIAAKGTSSGGQDVSREGVQRDILPIVEGSTVMTKYGAIKTDYILFIAAGAFHVSKVADLIPELQGRFPILVELNSLTKKDFVEILTTPKNAITIQYANLLKVDGVSLKFTEDAIDEIATIAEDMNATSEDIGARRLHTVMEELLVDISFEACGDSEKEVIIDRKYISEKLGADKKSKDLKPVNIKAMIRSLVAKREGECLVIDSLLDCGSMSNLS